MIFPEWGKSGQGRKRVCAPARRFFNDTMKTTMKIKLHSLFIGLALMAGVHEAAGLAATNTPAAIPWNQIGAKAGADYQGDGLAVTPNGEGARLHCVFQRLDGEATREGLWLTSTAIAPSGTVNDRFRVTAAAVGRVTPCAPGAADRTSNIQHPTSNIQLQGTGIISLAGQTVRLSRPGLVEEYRVSMDGVRQDFLVPARPAGAGELAVRLAVSGARVEPAAGGARPVRYPQQIEEAEHGSSLSHGARLVLNNSGRKLAYGRLRVTDATGRELAARMEVESSLASSRPKAEKSQSLLTSSATSSQMPDSALVVMVNDAEAVYPVRIDPTFSDADWSSMGGMPGTDGDVYASVVDASGNLYIGGSFTVVGETTANGIAKWNGTSWSALGSGMNGNVSALALSGSDLYAGGGFTTAGGVATTNIAKWEGTNWSALGSGLNGVVDALALSGSDLYAGGDFSTAGGVAANCVAKWNGSNWSALGSGLNGVVYALALSGSDLYAGGNFTTAGGNSANFVAKWDGSSWSALGSGMNDFVEALTVLGSDLYVGGNFSTAGGVVANSIAKWDGNSWSTLASGFGVDVAALAVSGSDLYAGGPFGVFAKWNGSSWSAPDPGVNEGDDDPVIFTLAVSGSNVYVGGEFTMAGGSAANGIAQWNGSSWSALGSGMNGYVSALAVSGSTLYVGGGFLTAGGANNIAQWNGTSWSALGSGMSGGDLQGLYVDALAVSGGTLYAGGDFTTAGGSPANYVAQWNGNSWSALGSGMNSYVHALAVSGSTLYAGGQFTSAGGNSANNIAQWNGTSWSALGSGMNNSVFALAVSGGTLYAGGYFTNAGGSAANYIAQWNGTSWSALGSGMNNSVFALAVSGGTLYAGGYFTNAGVSAANYIAQWNGSSWSALGSGMSGGDLHGLYVDALAVSGGTLYAGGDFTTAGGSPANYIAQWNGSSWSALGSGISGGGFDGKGPWVEALAVSGNDLYAGGDFTAAGGKLSYYLARAILRLPSLTLRQTTSSTVAVSWPSPSPGFVLQQNTAGLGSTNWSNATDSILDDGTNKMIIQPMGTSRFFRLVLP